MDKNEHVGGTSAKSAKRHKKRGPAPDQAGTPDNTLERIIGHGSH
jgi:hypothetical protein